MLILQYPSIKIDHNVAFLIPHQYYLETHCSVNNKKWF